MQNHCVNILRLEPRNKDNIQEVLKKFVNDANKLDFNKIIEMPKDLSTSMRFLEKVCENPKSTQKQIQKLEKNLKARNLEDYGYETPEDWARENWGPECNCYNFHWDMEKNSATFDTLSDPPLHIIAQIAQATKQTLLLTYAEPGEGKYGQFKANANGECEFKDFIESTIPEEFHKEFPSTYPPKNNKEHKSPKIKKTNPKTKDKNKGINIS